MSDYSGASSMIGKIKRAAIDCYMTDESNYYEIDGDRYRYRGSARGSTQYCSRPGSDGEGGGDASISGLPDFLVNHLDAQWRAAFDSIRGQVDDIFKDLKGVPTGTSLYFEETRAMSAAEMLTPRGATTALTPGGGSALSLNNPQLSQRVNAVHGYCYRLSSQTIDAFRQRYADRLGAILDGQAALAATLGMAAAGQVAVFQKLREDIAKFADEALYSLETLAGENQTSTGTGAPFAVGGALLSIASLSTGPGAAALATAGAISGLISDLWPDPPAKKTVTFGGGNVDAVLQSMSDGKTKILETPLDDETAIETALKNAHEAVRSMPGAFDIARPNYPGGGGTNETVGGPGTIQQNHDDMQRLAATCELVSEVVHEAKSYVSNADQGSGEWNRPAGIGLGTTGPYSAFNDLAADVVVLTRNTAEELGEAATKLIKASLNFQATDGEIASTLGREASELRQAEEDGDLLFD
ncbi:MAG: hypothetical protein V9G04_19175 [Nocardioides sp.]